MYIIHFKPNYRMYQDNNIMHWLRKMIEYIDPDFTFGVLFFNKKDLPFIKLKYNSAINNIEYL